VKASKPIGPTWRAFLVELAIYAALLVAYFFLVLHFLGGWFKEVFDHNRTIYAVVALVVMIGQAAGLEVVSSFIVWAIGPKKNPNTNPGKK
jgi:hypothetical protein